MGIRTHIDAKVGFKCTYSCPGIPGGSDGKESAHSVGDSGSFDPWVGKIPGEGNGKTLQYSCLKNSMDRGAWQATVCGVAKSQTQLNFHFHSCSGFWDH